MTSRKAFTKLSEMVSVMPGRTEKAAAARIIGAVWLRVRFLESTLHSLTGKLQKYVLKTASQSIFKPLDTTLKTVCNGQL